MLFNKEENPKWKVEALKIGLAVYPISTPDKPSRDGTCIKWESIEKVVAFKRDLLTEDLVCFGIFNDNDECMEIDEELIGFNQLLDQLPSFLAGFPKSEEYWGKLVQPAFATNEMELWHK